MNGKSKEARDKIVKEIAIEEISIEVEKRASEGKREATLNV